MATRRQQKIAELLHEELSMLIHQASDPRLEPVTVTGVEVTPDLRLAYVYVSVLGDEEEARQSLAGLRHAAGFLRRELGASVSLRYLPELDFRLDDSLQQGLHIDQLLDSLHDESPQDEGDVE
jgi:ribosome-binding factor A